MKDKNVPTRHPNRFEFIVPGYHDVMGFELIYHMEEMGWCEQRKGGNTDLRRESDPDGHTLMFYQDRSK